MKCAWDFWERRDRLQQRDLGVPSEVTFERSIEGEKTHWTCRERPVLGANGTGMERSEGTCHTRNRWMGWRCRAWEGRRLEEGSVIMLWKWDPTVTKLLSLSPKHTQSRHDGAGGWDLRLVLLLCQLAPSQVLPTGAPEVTARLKEEPAFLPHVFFLPTFVPAVPQRHFLTLRRHFFHKAEAEFSLQLFYLCHTSVLAFSSFPVVYFTPW